jgi:methionyl-tRNA synthetase
MAENPARCAQVVSRAVNLIYVLSSLIYPFMPATSDSILIQLNAPARVVPDVLSTDILPGHHIGRPEHLFKKIEEKMAEVWRAKFEGIDGNAQADGPKTTEPTMSKRKAAAAKKAAAKPETTKASGPKSPEVLALEAKVNEQGLLVRSLKGQTPKTPDVEDQIGKAVEELKRLKGELAAAL